MRQDSVSCLIKKLRKKNRISQRKLAKLSHVSFPQIQRVENASSNTTIETLSKILKIFDMKVEFHYLEPKWNYLAYFGFPISIEPKKCNMEKLFCEFKKAHFFLKEHYFDKNFERHIDALKAFLLTLYTHYAEILNILEKKANTDFINAWHVLNYTGKHIKLRNITLNILSERLKNGSNYY